MNLPNKLTLFRIILVPIVALVWLFPYSEVGINIGSFTVGNVSVPYLNVIVMALFALASFTDYLDGNIARKRNLVTTFGKFADPIADKLLVNMMLLILSYKHLIPLVCCILMILRDIVVDGCRMMAATNGKVVAAGMMGKLKTVLQMITVALVLLNNLPFELLGIPVSTFMLWFAAFVSFASGVQYFNQMKEDIMESK